MNEDDNKIEVTKRGSRLDINRDSELVHRFVRMNLEKNEEISDDESDNKEEKKSSKDAKDLSQKNDQPLQIQVPQLLSDINKKQSTDLKELEDDAKTEESLEPRSRKMSTVSTISTSSKPAKLVAKMINQELKKKKKRRRMRNRKNEECYTDKDRAAAISMGSKDIKTSLKAKRRQDRSKTLSIPEEAEPGSYIALGIREVKCGKFKLAVEFYSKALELNPNEKNALVARSQCYILMGRPDLALQDAEAALEIDKSYIRAIFQKAESLYFLGEFEHSLVYYHRGLRARPDMEGFRLGVHKAQKAIENAIGASIISRQMTPVSMSATQSQTHSRGPSRSTNTQQSTRRSKSTTASSSRLTQLPKQLCVEMKYLDGLLHHPDIKCRLPKNADLTPKIQEARDYLNARQAFWQQQIPPKLRL